ncbi:MAG: hypothetical protein AB7U20_18485 [Planctomycetaceae bacterium]
MQVASLIIAPDGIYLDGDVRLALDLTESALVRARRRGRLRFSRQGRSILYRGRWLLEWLERESQSVDREAAACQ